MYRAYRFESWTHTSMLISSVLNMFAEKGKEIQMDHFNLVIREEAARKAKPSKNPDSKHGIGALKVFLPRGNR